MHKSRLEKLEARLTPAKPRRLLVATVPPGGTVEAVAEANDFPLLGDDIVVVIKKPDGCPAGTIRAYEDAE